MLNIISNEYFKSSDKISGPIKVFRNLVKGLRLAGYPFVINGALDACNKLWVYNDPKAIKQLIKLKPEIKILLGPGFYLNRCITDDLRKVLSVKSADIVCLQPSNWARDMVLDSGFDLAPVEAWPAGIDTEEFTPRNSVSADRVLIYFKQRFTYELDLATKLLHEKGVEFETIVYGKYKEAAYKEVLQKTKYIIWIGRQESQGIALEEALAMNIPILVWEVNNVGHWVPPQQDINIFTATENAYSNTAVAPYFDERCGIKFTELDDLSGCIEAMESRWRTFEPREYILQNLSLEKQARDFINIFDKYWGLKFGDGLNDMRIVRRKWKNEFVWRLVSKIYYFFHDVVAK